MATRGLCAVQIVSMELAVIAQQPCRNITLAVEHAPDLDVILALNVADQMRVVIERP